VVALVLARWAWLERTVKPYIVAFQTLPRIAIAPLFLIWFGQGRLPKVLLATLVAFFPVMVNTLAGLKSSPPEWLEWMHAHGASSWQTFRHVKVWSALPFIFAGLEVALVFSILGVVVTEFVGASEGLGVLILQSHYAVDVAGVFSVFVILVTFGLLLRFMLMSVRSRLLFWAELGENREG
jgi:NitT/TauT family transport system permease protein